MRSEKTPSMNILASFRIETHLFLGCITNTDLLHVTNSIWRNPYAGKLRNAERVLLHARYTIYSDTAASFFEYIFNTEQLTEIWLRLHLIDACSTIH